MVNNSLEQSKKYKCGFCKGTPSGYTVKRECNKCILPDILESVKSNPWNGVVFEEYRGTCLYSSAQCKPNSTNNCGTCTRNDSLAGKEIKE